MHIKPETAMAVAIQASKGVYACLIGSGVSRAAEIPTGWEVIQDLAARVAKAAGEDPGKDPAAWYMKKYNEPPTYSGLIESLAPTTAGREILLRSYFEPTNEEMERGAKVPTAAHRAIAKLVSGGFIRVIVTTNFDRLMERALQDEGVSPTVVASAAQAEGALPLQHTRCLILKIHGDYLDTRIRNTADELKTYEPALQALLIRILEEFGLIVAGWSGDYDTALGDAIEQATRHRFNTYWMVRGEVGNGAQRVIKTRHARVVPVESADLAFTSLLERVLALEDGTSADPISPDLAIRQVKRMLADEKGNRIRLSDFFEAEAHSVVRLCSPDAMPLGHPSVTKDSYRNRVARMESATAVLLPSIAVAVRWGSDDVNGLLERVLVIMARNERPSGPYNTIWWKLRSYPASLVFYTLGVACIHWEKHSFLGRLLTKTGIHLGDTELSSPVVHLHAHATLHYQAADFMHDTRRKLPGSDHIEKPLRAMIGPLFDHVSQFEEAFDRFEILLSLLHASAKKRAVFGSFAWKDFAGPGTLSRFIKEMDEAAGSHWAFRAGILGTTATYSTAKGILLSEVSQYQ
jgi:hypothetical protein